MKLYFMATIVVMLCVLGFINEYSAQIKKTYEAYKWKYWA